MGDMMLERSLVRTLKSGALLLSALALSGSAVRADGDLHKVNHIIIMMQENRSFDHYLGALPYAKGTPYHAAKATKTNPVPTCKTTDSKCVDGLTCKKKKGALICSNSNLDPTGDSVTSFHQTNYCPGPDFDHSWDSSH